MNHSEHRELFVSKAYPRWAVLNLPYKRFGHAVLESEQ